MLTKTDLKLIRADRQKDLNLLEDRANKNFDKHMAVMIEMMKRSDEQFAELKKSIQDISEDVNYMKDTLAYHIDKLDTYILERSNYVN